MKKLSLFYLFYFVLFFHTQAQNKPAYVSGNYEKFGLKQGNVPEKWEDGIRTGGKKGTYEWWYFDAHLEDSTTVVIVFYTKPFTEIKKGLIPFITINIDRPNGISIKKAYYGKAEEFSASKDSCNIVIGENFFKGNLKNYEIYFKDEELTINVKFKRTTESWRPKTGYFIYGNQGKEFAWLVPVPKGKAQVSYKYKGKKYVSQGSCYHDHNFGNTNMANVINHWYWSRADLGEYSIIAAELISEKEYGNEPVIVFNISKGGKTIADDAGYVKLFRTYPKINKQGGKPVSDELKFIYDKDKIKYEFTLKREKDLFAVKILDGLIQNKFKKQLAELLTGFDGAYYRFSGKTNLKVYHNDCKTEEYSSEKAVWELMYFGKPFGIK